MSGELLSATGLSVNYGHIEAVRDIDLSLQAGQITTLVGANGAGKSTTLLALSGLVPKAAGKVMFDGHDVSALPAHKLVAAGLVQVAEGRATLTTLTVRENLVATAVARAGGGWTLARVHELFPRLAERAGSMGNQLSGGEQQMLAIGRALMTNPRLLILDEATEGLAPLIRAEIWRCLARLKESGLAILVIDKNVGALTRVADRHFLIERGRVVWSGLSAELAAAPEVQHRYLGV